MATLIDSFNPCNSPECEYCPYYGTMACIMANSKFALFSQTKESSLYLGFNGEKLEMVNGEILYYVKILD